MSVINLSDEQYNLPTGVKIFNGGIAGIVNGAKARIERKKATDSEKAPKYKVILKDESDAEMNKGYFDGIDTKFSNGQKGFFVKEMKHLASLFGATLPATIETYDGLLDATMKACFEKGEIVVNAAVHYGTLDYPKAFLEIGSAFNLVKATQNAYMNPKYQLTRVLPDAVMIPDANQPAGTFADQSLTPQKGDLPW